VIAYKVLRAGAVGPFSGYTWPLPRGGGPGPWVAAGGRAICRDAVHGCRVADLPWWLGEELWEAEFDGPVATGRHKISAPRARLLRRVEGWDAACARRFAEACAERAHALAAGAATIEPGAANDAIAMAGDAAQCARTGDAAVTAYVAAQVAGRVGGPDAMTIERTAQAAWLRFELGLAG
jgi:hypothetical protein